MRLEKDLKWRIHRNLPKTSTSRFDLHGTPILTLAFGADSLNELQKWGLLPRFSLQNITGENLVQDIISLDIYQDFVSNNAHVCID